MDKEKLARIWQTIAAIPEGRVATYGQIADLAGLPGRARLVGKALGVAPKTMNLPWFRVINSQGKISLPEGSEPFTAQRTQLMSEGVVVKGARISLKVYQWQPELYEMLAKLP